MKKPLFIHGLGEQASDYKHFTQYFDLCNIDWNQSLMDQVVKIHRKYNTIVGFSWGAVAACLYAGEFPVKVLVLCSMPSGADAAYMANLKADEVFFVYGEKEEWPAKDNRRILKIMKRQVTHQIIVPNEGHKITEPYLKSILQITNSAA